MIASPASPGPRHPAYLKSTVVLSVLLSAIFESLARNSRSQWLFGGAANGFICVRGLGMAAMTTRLVNFPSTPPECCSPPQRGTNQTYGDAPVSFRASFIVH